MYNPNNSFLLEQHYPLLTLTSFQHLALKAVVSLLAQARQVQRLVIAADHSARHVATSLEVYVVYPPVIAHARKLSSILLISASRSSIP